MKFIDYANQKAKPNLRIRIQAEPPIHLERQFQREILNIIEPAINEINRIVLKKLPQWLDYYSLNRDGFFDDNEKDDTNELSSWFDKLQNMLITYLSYKGIKNIVSNFSHKIIKYSKDKLDKQMNKMFNLNPFYSEDNIKKSVHFWIDKNIKNISDIPKNYINKLQILVNNIINQNKANDDKKKSIEIFKESLTNTHDKIENNVANLSRDQVNSLDGEITMILQKEIGVMKFIWQTCRDERVRKTHRELEGQLCEWDDLPKIAGETVWPGSQFNCRCTAKPIF